MITRGETFRGAWLLAAAALALLASVAPAAASPEGYYPPPVAAPAPTETSPPAELLPEVGGVRICYVVIAPPEWPPYSSWSYRDSHWQPTSCYVYLYVGLRWVAVTCW